MATKTAKASKNGTVRAITIPALRIEELTVKVVGDTPLIVHRFSEKAKEMMRQKQQKKARQAKEAKDPEQDFRESLYQMPRKDGSTPNYADEFGQTGFGAKAIWFKQAAVRGAKSCGAVMTDVKSALHIVGEGPEQLIRIEGSEPQRREDHVRLAKGVADLRYRGCFYEWFCVVRLRYNATTFSAEEIINFLNAGGFASGVGDWRVTQNGTYGMFHVETA